MRRPQLCLLLLCLVNCAKANTQVADGSTTDGGGADGLKDSGLARDAGSTDGNVPDATTTDGNVPDRAGTDGNAADGGGSDRGVAPDAGTPDGGVLKGCGTSAFDLNDVSFLFPLPPTLSAVSSLLSLDAVGNGGALLPSNLRSGLPSVLHQFPGRETVFLAQVRVIGVRVDPCFPGPNNTCRKQIRLVAQQFNSTMQPPITIDSTVHLFYDLDDTEFATLVAGLKSLKQKAGAKTACQPLGAHPVMSEEGLDGPYATSLKSLILSVAGSRTLKRVAVMKLGFPGETWEFDAFDLVGAAFTAASIPKLGQTTSQEFVVPDVGGLNGILQVNPTPSAPAFRLVLGSMKRQTSAQADIQAEIDLAFRIENPRLENPTTIDCVSCHIADRIRRMTATERGVEFGSVNSYANPSFDLSLPKDGHNILTAQRAFGYFDRKVSISQRTINESAEVAAQLSRL